MNSKNVDIPIFEDYSWLFSICWGLNLSDKINLSWSDKYVTLSNPSIYHTSKNTKESYKSNKFKISSKTWNEEFVLPDRSYSISNIKKHETFTDNPPIGIYINKIENRIAIKMKAGYYKQLITAETMKLLGSTKHKMMQTYMIQMVKMCLI